MRCTACLLFACGLLVAPVEGGAQSSPGQPPPEPGAQQAAGGRAIATEVVGLDITGPMPFQKAVVADLDSLVTPSGERLIPLRHLLQALQIESEYIDGRLSFSPNTTVLPVDVVVDTGLRLVRVNVESRPVTMVAGVSDVTEIDEIYVSAEAVNLSLRIQLEWDEAAFGFKGQTDQTFAIWKHFDKNLLAVETTRVPTTLPELFPAAAPRQFSLDFMEFELRPFLTTTGDRRAAATTSLAIDAPRESFWGNAFGGRYRVRLSQPGLLASAGTRSRAVAPVTLDHVEWTYSLPNAEVAVGDSTYGVSDLIFPILRTTGVRFSGVAGMTGVRSGRIPGMSGSFSRSQVFEGVAENGSSVELILNGQPIQTQVVISGVFRFEEVRLAPGTLNNILIRIIEPSGLERVIERNVFGRSIQLPRRGFAHLGGIGATRDNRNWSAKGVTAAERILYGITDSLTVGTTWAVQRDGGPPGGAISIGGGGFGFPSSSAHRGAQVSWLPIEHLQLIGDVAFSDAETNRTAYSGRAYRVNTDLFPRRDMRLSTQWFDYSPGYFNGDNLQLRDRAGYTFDFSWRLSDRLQAASSGGALRNNLDGLALSPFNLEFQRVELTAGLSRRLATVVSLNRFASSQASSAPIVYAVRMQANPYKSVTTDLSLSRGLAPESIVDTQLSSGISIPGYSPYQLQLVAFNARVPLGNAHSVGASYFRGPGGNRASITESFSPGGTRFRMVTEVGYDARTRQPFLSERSEYRLDRASRKSIGLDVRFELGRWTSMVNFTFSELFRNEGGMPRPVADPGVSADNGAIYGKVFVDANADGKRDAGEPGLDGVAVISDTGTKSTTDKNGYFAIPASGQAATYRVYLDIDTVPANYSPTHGIQSANVRSGSLTIINLGLSPLNSVTGVVHMQSENGVRPIGGVRVMLKRTADDKEITDSITGEDGTYYLSDIRPGQYTVHVDPRTLPPGTSVQAQPLTIEISPSVNSQDLRLSPYIVE